MNIREVIIEDYAVIIRMLESTPGVTVRDADSRDSTEAYLKRNPGLSFVATLGSKVIGCVMCAHDGRRGYLQHLVVIPENRQQDVGGKLFKRCIDALQVIGISKTHIFVIKANELANDYWTNKGWKLRDDINMYSYNCSPNENA